jgi:hypothetical protein
MSFYFSIAPVFVETAGLLAACVSASMFVHTCASFSVPVCVGVNLLPTSRCLRLGLQTCHRLVMLAEINAVVGRLSS